MTKKPQHLEYQKQYFDANCDFFRQPIPAEVEAKTLRIVTAAQLDKDSKVLDVGTGMGALIKHFLESGVSEDNITGCDLSARMLEEAKQRYPRVRFWLGDISEFDSPPKTFDAVFFNACFGNIFDRERALEVAAGLLKDGGKIVISHPLGNHFVKELQESNSDLVLTLMPDRQLLLRWCEELPLELSVFCDEPDFYLSILRRKPDEPAK
jgi:ubiquinone/menaquinone biosynthesis C-methylase UbiE